jgi:hypothetical protein
LEHSDGGFGLFVLADLDVSDPRIVIHDGVQVPDPEPGLIPVVAGALPVGSGGPIHVTLVPAHKPVPATVGDPAELRHVDVDEVPGVVVFVAADTARR